MVDVRSPWNPRLFEGFVRSIQWVTGKNQAIAVQFDGMLRLGFDGAKMTIDLAVRRG